MQQVKHTVPMLHIAPLESAVDVYTHCVDLLRMGARSIAAEVKLEGLSCDLTYRQGHLTLATVRGTDVCTGYDVTEIARQCAHIPNFIQQSMPLVIRGVLVLPIEVLMDQRDSFSDPDYTKACVREALNPLHPCHSALEFVMTDHVAVDINNKAETHLLIREFVHTGSCRVNTQGGFTERDFHNMLSRVNSIKNSNRYDSCGIVIKIRNMLPGEPGAEFYTGIFSVLERRVISTGTIRGGWWVVTKSGKLVPYYHVAEGERLLICNMYNLRNALRCGFRIGDTVAMDRRGHSHPTVRGLLSATGTDVLPLEREDCPECGHRLTTVGFDQYCKEETCSGRMISWLRFVTGKSIFDVPRITDAQLQQLWGLCSQSTHPIQIALFKVPAHEISVMLHDAIQRHMVIPLYKAFAMLNLPSLAVVTLKNIAQGNSTLQSIFQNSDRMRNERERNILREWWADPEHRNLVYKMDRFFVYGTPPTRTFDRNVCITGRFNCGRGALMRKLYALGFGVHGSLNRRTDAVLAGEAPGLVVDMAKERNIPVVNNLEELKQL